MSFVETYPRVSVISSLSIQINEGDMAEVQRMLGGIGNSVTKVISRAVNKTLAGVGTDSADEISKEITAKKSAIKKTFRATRATVTNLTAKFECTGRPLLLSEYSVRQVQKGVSVQVKRKGEGRKVLAHAFIAPGKHSGKKIVFMREFKGGGTSVKSGIQEAMGRMGYVFNRKTQVYFPVAALPRQYRYPIKAKYGPRVPDILSNQPVMARVLDKAGERLHKNMQHELQYELSQVT